MKLLPKQKPSKGNYDANMMIRKDDFVMRNSSTNPHSKTGILAIERNLLGLNKVYMS